VNHRVLHACITSRPSALPLRQATHLVRQIQ
jgi:hypothetical protein